jgi:hypothetical protein
MFLTLLFYGSDGPAAKVRAADMRGHERKARPILAEACHARQACDAIAFMDDVSAYDRDRLTALFAPVVNAPPPVPVAVVPPPPGPPPSPLDGLSEDWKDKGGADELKRIAAAISGRTVDNRAQAVAVIDAALAARK